MATHSSVLAWRIPARMGLPSMVSHRVGHHCSDLAAGAAAAGIKHLLYILYPELISAHAVLNKLWKYESNTSKNIML